MWYILKKQTGNLLANSASPNGSGRQHEITLLVLV